MKKYIPVLTIAGCDPSGGAGILADLKTFMAHGCYGMAVVTVLTAQNTVGVQGAQPMTGEFVEEQLESVLSDITPKAVKIGMLLNEEIILAVAKKLKEYGIKNIVLDPVMVASSGDPLLQQSAIDCLKSELMPLANLVTPNLYEAKVLAGDNSKSEMAKTIIKQGARNVLIKGGHDQNNICQDLLSFEGNVSIKEYPKIVTKNTHGTGCTLSAAIACNLAKGMDIKESYENAREYIQKAIISGAKYQLGQGHGPVNHST